MNIFLAELSEKIKRTPSIESFRFKIKERIDFLPGQFVRVIFDGDDLANKELNKYLSFSSSPAKAYIEVTKRLSESAFSAKLKALQKGESVLMQGPMGNCIYKQEYKKIGFLIGGIGITPVISILEYILEKKLDTDIILVYSSRNNAEIAFRSELSAWHNENSNLQILYTVTDSVPDNRTFMQGQINKGLLGQRFKNLSERKFFIYGPPVMVQAMKELCIEFGCDKNKIIAENFLGY